MESVPPKTTHAAAWLHALPPAALVLVAAVVFELVSWVGFSLIAGQLFKLSQMLFYSSDTRALRSLKREVVRLRTELAGTSSMDEFAKWAKARRKLDASTAQLTELTQSMAFRKTTFTLKAHVATRVVFYLLYLVVMASYQRTAMFYVAAEDWFGSLSGSLLALPFAPEGSVGVVVWVMASRRVVRNILEQVFGSEEEMTAGAKQDDGDNAKETSPMK
ncbi:GET complex subunit get1 [Sorochytrium milnesiophthora]